MALDELDDLLQTDQVDHDLAEVCTLCGIMPLWKTFLRVLGAKQLHPSAIIVRSVFGALPCSFGKNLVEIRGEMQRIPEQVLLRVLADSGGRVALVAVLARRSLICAKGAFLPASHGTAGLRCSKR